MTWTQRSRQAGGGHRTGKHTNAHRPPGPAQTKFAWVEPGRGCRALHDGGWGNHE